MVMQLENTAGMIKDQNTSEHFLKSSSRFVNHEHPEEALKNKTKKKLYSARALQCWDAG